MFRCDRIGEINAFLNRVTYNRGSVISQGSFHDLLFGQRVRLDAQLFIDLFQKRFAGCQQYRAGHRIVFRLGKQVRRCINRISAFIRDDQNFARTGDHIDIHFAVDEFLGRRDIDVARTRDLVNRSDGFGAIGKCGHRLGAADLVDLRDTGKSSRKGDIGIDGALFVGRRDHDNPLNSCHMGGNRIHQNGTGILRSAAGHIDADAFQRKHPLSKEDAVFLLQDIGVLNLCFMEVFDVCFGLFHGLFEEGIAGFDCLIDFLFADPEAFRINAIELLRIITYRRVASFTHIRNDAGS